MRMLVLALLVFVLAGISIGLSRLGISELAPRILAGNGPHITFEVESDTAELGKHVGVLRARPEGVMLLSRTNTAQTARFQLPQDAGVMSGVLELNIAAQISDSQDSLLRVLVGNQTRGEVLLRPGQRDITAEIGLTSDDLANEALAIRYALVSPDIDGACSNDAGWSNVIEIEQDSQLRLEVANAKITPRDQVALWGNEVLIGWPAWLPEEKQQYRWAAAMNLAQRGFDVRFVDAPDTETMSGNALEELVNSDVAPYVIADEVAEWPEYIALAGANLGKKSFQRSTTWRHWYRIGAEDHTSDPTGFHYEMMLGPLPNDASWTVVVTHNNSIIDAQRVPGNVAMMEGTVSFDGLEIEHSNLIEITATSGYEPTGLCNNGPELFAELRPETRLIGGGEAYTNNMETVLNRLNQRQPVSISLPADMSLVEAQRMLDLANEVIPAESEITLSTENATLNAVRRSAFTSTLSDLPETTHIVWYDENNQVTSATPSAFTGTDAVVAVGALALIADLGDLAVSSEYRKP